MLLSSGGLRQTVDGGMTGIVEIAQAVVGEVHEVAEGAQIAHGEGHLGGEHAGVLAHHVAAAVGDRGWQVGGVLVEGWNVGWDGDWIANADLFSFTEAYPDYDLEGLAAYAGERGVTLIGHNETSMGVENYESQLDDAFALYQSLGIRAVKTGYVGDKTAEGHAHHGQYMVRHFRMVIEVAARHGEQAVAAADAREHVLLQSFASAVGDGGAAEDRTTSARDLLILAHAATQNPLTTIALDHRTDAGRTVRHQLHFRIAP